ncbi:MAG: DUF1446 domain-containing protein [Proteobacteria bacterium]|nr:DUF1446 domain-containing protein [Pseudomonadota bacterium]
MGGRILRIGGGCGFWGDSAAGPAQLVRHGDIDILVLDYLAEITLSLLARVRRRRPELGYATDFVSAVMGPLAAGIAARGIRVVTNAGGVNPHGCAAALRAVLRECGVDLRVAVVSGDDISGKLAALGAAGVRTPGGEPLPAQVESANVYLGAAPIAAALSDGADVVITGRCVDSALALGPLMAAFGWQASDLDLLAAGSLAGHVIECGTQATGGVFTDWQDVAAGWDDMGYPVVECHADGSFIVSKPQRTGGRVDPATVAEQIVYEIHDPAAYVLPDVTCDFSGVHLQDLGQDRVRVLGARGVYPPAHYKASLTSAEGFRCTATLMIAGGQADARARAVGEAILKRTRRMLSEQGFADYSAVSVEVLGAGEMYPPAHRPAEVHEILLKIAVAHAEEKALELFAREIAPAATSMAQGITGFAGGRPAVQPLIRLVSCLVPRNAVDVRVEVDPAPSPPRPLGRDCVGADSPAAIAVAAADAPPANGGHLESATKAAQVTVPLLRLAHGRSGDKGDVVNIGVLARHPRWVPFLEQVLTAQRVAEWFAHLVEGPVERFDWPGLSGWNFVLQRALGGGGTASLRYDPQGKTYAQVLLDMPVTVPAGLLR